MRREASHILFKKKKHGGSAAAQSCSSCCFVHYLNVQTAGDKLCTSSLRENCVSQIRTGRTADKSDWFGGCIFFPRISLFSLLMSPRRWRWEAVYINFQTETIKYECNISPPDFFFFFIVPSITPQTPLIVSLSYCIFFFLFFAPALYEMRLTRAWGDRMSPYNGDLKY